MKTGFIMSIEKNWAYIFTDSCQMKKIALHPRMTVGQEIRLPQEENEHVLTWSRRRMAWTAAAAMLVLALTLSILVGTGAFLTPVYATLAIDINPSIEMDLNRSLNVIQVRAMNMDAAALLEGQAFKGMNWEDVVRQWTYVVEAHQARQVRLILLSVVLPEGAVSMQTRLLQFAEQMQNDAQEHIQIRLVYSHDANVRKMAKENGISIGRQMLLNQSQARHQAWDAESIVHAPLGELVRQLLHESDHDQTGLTLAERARTLTETIGQGEPSTERTTQQVRQTIHNESGQSDTSTHAGSDQRTAGNQPAQQRETHRETIVTRIPTESGEQITQRETQRETTRQSQPEEPSSPNGSQMSSPAASSGPNTTESDT